MSHLLRGAAIGFPVDPADFPGTIPGGRYILGNTNAAAAAIAAVGRYHCQPFMADFPGPITAIGVSVGAGGTVASTMKVALTAANLATMRPTGLPLTANNAGASVAGTGVIELAVPAVMLQRGQLYFVVSVYTWDTSAPQIVPAAGTATQAATLLGTGLGAGAQTHAQGWRFDGTYSNNIAALDFGAQTYTPATGATVPNHHVGVP